MDNTKEVYTVAEVAKILNIGLNQAYEACRKNEIKNFRVNRRIIIPRRPFDAKLGKSEEAATS